MKKLLIVIGILFGIVLSSYGQKISELPAGSSLASGDLFVIVQSGTTKKLQYVYLGNVISDSSDVLRAELPPLWRTDIGDTADVLRIEIANAATIDTAWARSSGYIILKYINDSVGVGTTTPTSKFEVNGEIKALSADLDDGYDNLLLGDGAGTSLTASSSQNILIGINAGAAATDPSGCIGIGYYALNSMSTNATNNVCIGQGESYYITTGIENTTINSGANPLTTGQRNFFGGYLAGRTCATSSSNNVFIGYKAGYDADINNSVFIGSEAGYSFDQVGVGIGFRSLHFATSSVGSTALGAYSASALTTSDYHSVFGYQALDAVQTSDGSSVFGYQAGSAATASDGLSAFGYKSLTAVTTGITNSAFGYNSGLAATTADGLSLFGYDCGVNITEGDYNSFFGSLCGDAITTSSNHSAFGWNSLSAAQTSDGSSVFGYAAGNDVTSSDGLCAFGYQAANQMTTSDYHSVFGYQALDAGQTSDGSSVFGYQAGSAATGAAGFSAFGYQSGLATTTGDQNSFFGYQSGKTNTTGSYNTFVGYNSGSIVVDGSLNSIFGTSAGAQVVSGINNTMIGAESGAESGDVTGVLYLGYAAGYSNTTNNVLFIDNSGGATPLIWGDFTADSVIINGDLRATGYAGGATAWTNESDRRLKKNITPITDGLKIVKGLEGVRFKWIDGREPGVRVGFIAQDVETVLPEVVYPGEPYAMQTSQITAVNVMAIQELHKQVQLMKIIILLLGIGLIISIIRSRKKFIQS